MKTNFKEAMLYSLLGAALASILLAIYYYLLNNGYIS